MKPTAKDLACLDAMLAVIDGLPPEGRATDVIKKLRVPKSNVYSRGSIVETLGACGIFDAQDPGAELAAWLQELTIYTATHRGALRRPGRHRARADLLHCDGPRGAPWPRGARSAAGALNADARTDDLMHLANAIGVATEDDPEAAARLLRIALDGARRPTQVAPEKASTAKRRR